MRPIRSDLANKTPCAKRSLITAQRGYTLVEVFFAIFIVATVFLGLSGMTVTLIQSNSSNDFADIAVDLAQDKLEELKSASFTSAVVADVNSTNNSELESVSNFDFRQTNLNEMGRPGGIFTRTWNIADNAPKSGMKTAVVIVTWTDQLGSHRVSFRTIL